MWSIDLTGRVGVVVGGAGAIGAACARALAQAGAGVVIADAPAAGDAPRGEPLARELRDAGHDAWAVEVEVTQDDSAQAMVARVRELAGRLDLVIYSAGLAERVAFADLTAERWERMLAVNLTGAYRVVRAALPELLARRGTVVLIGSQVAVTGGGGGAHYAASKAGMEGLTRALSRELLPQGVRVNTVEPCLVDTPMLRRRYANEQDVQTLVAQVPRGRLGRPEDIANAALFLVSDAADFICGQHLMVDGGRTFSH